MTQVFSKNAQNQRRCCAVRRPAQIVTYVPMPEPAVRVRASCRHWITEYSVLTIARAKPKPSTDPTFIEFTSWELLSRRTNRRCLNCELEKSLQEVIVCANCGAFIFPGDGVVLGQHEHNTPLAYTDHQTVVVESGDIVRCTSPECSAHVQHHRGVWNGTMVEVPILARHHHSHNGDLGRGSHGHEHPNP